MQQLSIDELVGPARAAGVRCISVMTATGSSTVDGRSEKMGNRNDAKLLKALRQWADVVVVGAQTVKKEDYAGVRRTESDPCPAPIAVVTRSLNFDPDSRFFNDYFTAPLFLVPSVCLIEQNVQMRKSVIERAGGQVHGIGSGSVREMLTLLQGLGYTRISCEGGPSLLSQFIAADVVDQYYLTLDARISSAVETPAVVPSQGDCPAVDTRSCRMRLENVAADADGTVFLRYGNM